MAVAALVAGGVLVPASQAHADDLPENCVEKAKLAGGGLHIECEGGLRKG